MLMDGDVIRQGVYRSSRRVSKYDENHSNEEAPPDLEALGTAARRHIREWRIVIVPRVVREP